MNEDPALDALRRTGRWARALVALGLVLALLLGAVPAVTDWMWYVHDLRRPQVLSVAYTWQGLTFLISLGVALAFLVPAWRAAVRGTVVYGEDMVVPGGPQFLGAVERAYRWVPATAALVVGFFTASGFSSAWRTWLLAQRGPAFGERDPVFGLDLGFWAFRLPWIEEVVSLLFWLTVAAWLGYLGLSELHRTAARGAGGRLIHRARDRHLHLLGALVLFALAGWMAVGVLRVAYADGGQFVGPGQALTTTLPIRQIFPVLLVGAGIAYLIAGGRGKGFARPWLVPVALLALWIVAVEGTGTVVQRFTVDPNRLNAEGPYAARALRMTAYGYGLGEAQLRTQERPAAPRPTAEAIQAGAGTLGNMRLWDPDVLRQAFDQLQSLRSYYSFEDVDVDRYVLDGEETLVMLAPRDLRSNGLPQAAQNWTNLRLRYTHGYGVAVARVDQATGEGEPAMIRYGIPERGVALPVERPQIYFSDRRDPAGRPMDDYAVVATAEPELDYESAGQTVTHRWTGDRGVPVGGGWARFLFAMRLRDGNLLVSSNIRPDSKLLMIRNVGERASRAFPFLRFDLDPYLVLSGGRPTWILDGYLTSDRIPCSAFIYGATGRTNYVRNVAKVTVDAYTGEVRGYALNEGNPFVRAYGAIYPGSLQPLSEMPPPLRNHLRYPEDLMSLQAAVLTQYHVRDPRVFLSNSDAWSLANEVGPQGVTEPVRPFYVMIALPGEDRPRFTLILPFTPVGKPNMSGWLAARMGPEGRPQLDLVRFRGDLPPGPELMEAKFNSTPEIANINRQFNNEQSEILVGNSLVIPLGDSFLYAESLFLRSRTTGIQATPRLTRVILAFADQVVVGDTYEEALRELLGTRPNQPVSTPPRTGAAPPASPGRETVRQAAELLDQADAALRRGDFARYGELQRQARERLRSILE